MLAAPLRVPAVVPLPPALLRCLLLLCLLCALLLLSACLVAASAAALSAALCALCCPVVLLLCVCVCCCLACLCLCCVCPCVPCALLCTCVCTCLHGICKCLMCQCIMLCILIATHNRFTPSPIKPVFDSSGGLGETSTPCYTSSLICHLSLHSSIYPTCTHIYFFCMCHVPHICLEITPGRTQPANYRNFIEGDFCRIGFSSSHLSAIFPSQRTL
jgi:hypothetical protein